LSEGAHGKGNRAITVIIAGKAPALRWMMSLAAELCRLRLRVIAQSRISWLLPRPAGDPASVWKTELACEAAVASLVSLEASLA
jgi:hypothetical protein